MKMTKGQEHAERKQKAHEAPEKMEKYEAAVELHDVEDDLKPFSQQDGVVQTQDDAVILEDDDKVGALVNEWETWSHRGGAGFVFQPSTSSSLLPSTSSSTSSPGGVQPMDNADSRAAFCAAMDFSQDKLGSRAPPSNQCPTQ